jgi:restriction endonuclease Mrr
MRKNTYALSIPDSHEIDDVLDAHVNMSTELLDAIESYEPDHFEHYATEIIAKMGAFDRS